LIDTGTQILLSICPNGIKFLTICIGKTIIN